MKRILLLITLSFTVCKLSARENSWYEGSVVLQTHEVLVGKISIEDGHDLILFKDGDHIKVFPAHKIQSVHFYDTQANVNRKFISIRETNFVWCTHRLYEVVLQGEVSVLRKAKTRSTNSSDADGYVYFVRHQNETLDLKSFRSKVYPALTRQGGPTLSMFMFDHHLNPNSQAHAIQIIRYYNELMRTDQSLARY